VPLEAVKSTSRSFFSPDPTKIGTERNPEIPDNYRSDLSYFLISYMQDSAHLEKYDRAYQVALLLMDHFNFPESLITSQSTGSRTVDAGVRCLVEIFSYYEYVDVQRLQKLESLFMNKGSDAYGYLLDLYEQRKMYQQLVNFYSDNQEALKSCQLASRYSQALILSCLSCKNFELALTTIDLKPVPHAKSFMKGLRHFAMGDQVELENSIADLEEFVKNGNTTLKLFIKLMITLLKKDELGTMRSLEDMRKDQASFANLIYLKERNNAPLSIIQPLKTEYENDFGKPYKDYHREKLGSMIDFTLER